MQWLDLTRQNSITYRLIALPYKIKIVFNTENKPNVFVTIYEVKKEKKAIIG